MSEILTTEEAAQYLKTSPDTIKRLARAGRIPGVKFGRAWRFRKRDIEAPFDEALADQALVAELDRRMEGACDEDSIPLEEVIAKSRQLP
jgi:excisionase family DNA binding protein